VIGRNVQSVVVTCFAVILFAMAARAQSTEPATESAPEKRIFGVLPNYRTVDGSAPFSPLSAKQKLNIARHDSFDWPSYVFAAGLVFITPKDKSLGTGVQGYANRYVRSAADQIMGNMLTEGILPGMLHQDPRYFRQGESLAFWPRFRSAVSQIAVARNDSGRRTFNTAEFLGNAVAVGISNSYSPNLNSWSRRADKLAIMISTDTFANVLKEFAPDLKQKFLHRRHKST